MSNCLNIQIVHIKEKSGKSASQIARDLCVSKNKVLRVLKVYKEKGNPNFNKKATNNQKIFETAKMWIKAKTLEDQSISIRKLQADLKAKYNIELSVSHLYFLLRKMGVRRAVAKKKPFLSEIHLAKRKKFVDKLFSLNHIYMNIF